MARVRVNCTYCFSRMLQAAEARCKAIQRGTARSPRLRDTDLPRSSLEADPEYLLAIERQQRQLLEVRLQAQMDANEALRRDNLELSSHFTITSRQLRAALRSRDELRHQAAEATALEDAVRAAVGRRSLQATQALCASLRARVHALEGQVAQLQSSAWRDEVVGGRADTPSSAAVQPSPRVRTWDSPRRLSPPASPAGSTGAAVLGISSEATRSRPPQRAAPPASTPDAVSNPLLSGPPSQMFTPDAAVLASFAGPLSTAERQVLLNLDVVERAAVLRELLSLAVGLPSQG